METSLSPGSLLQRRRAQLPVTAEAADTAPCRGNAMRRGTKRHQGNAPRYRLPGPTAKRQYLPLLAAGLPA